MKKLISLCLLILLVGFNLCEAADVTLSWTPPTTNVDGTPLTDLKGYKIYTSNVHGVYDKLKAIDVGNVVTSTLTNFCEGLYYFVATAYDTSGNESSYSNEVSKQIIIVPTSPSELKIQ